MNNNEIDEFIEQVPSDTIQQYDEFIFPLSIEKELLLMNEFKLTAEEILFLKLAFLAKENNYMFDTETKNFRLFIDQILQTSLNDILNSLYIKGIITKDSYFDENNLSIDTLTFTKVFMKRYEQCDYTFGRDLFDKYPSIIYIDGKRCNAKNITRYYSDLDQFYFTYCKKIKYSKKKHLNIMNLLQWGIDNGQIVYSVVEFVASEKWKELEMLRDKGDSTFNTLEML